MAISNYSEFFNKDILRNKGFTIAELLVVMGITAILFSSLVFYSRSAERQIILFKEQMKIITALQKAKSLAIVAFSEGQTACGYGVNFDRANDKMIIFREQPASGGSGSCSTRDNIYTSVDELYEEIKLDNRTVRFGNLINSDGGIFSNVVFISPEPITVIDYSGSSGSESATIEITDISGSNTKIVKVTDAGQITAQ